MLLFINLVLIDLNILFHALEYYSSIAPKLTGTYFY